MKSRGPYRGHSTPFKLQLCQDIRNGVIGRRDAQRTYGDSANLIQLWLTQFDRGELNDEEAVLSAVDMALKSGVPTKTHVLNLLHRLVDGKSFTPPTLDAPQALTLTNEPKGDVLLFTG
ncbi:hypothetical protein J2Z17_004231 [Rhizobium halophytocola]|uniref:Transposase n=1 Tax=Rhizobium halophytocola TaxID=735519 RepID=A0ABS4E4C0_9HYPH|nr:hypothetical protein [Rhizobium halophytocola]